MKYQGIIFSGLPGSGKSTLAAAVSQIFGWQYHSIGHLWREKWEKLYPDGKISREDYWRQVADDENLAMDTEFRRLAVKGNLVGDLRYVAPLRDLSLLLIFITADLEIRASRAVGLSKYAGKNKDELKKLLLQREIDEAMAGQRLYQEDYRDSCHYHLTLNSGMMSQEEEIAVVKILMSLKSN